MGKTLKQILSDAVKSLSFKTTVDDLKKKGVRKVNVIGLDRIVGLVEEAVRTTLAKSLYSLNSSVQTTSLASKAKEEFVRLLEHARTLEKARDEAIQKRKELEKQIDELRLELIETKNQLEEERKRIQESAEARLLIEGAKISEAIKKIFASYKGENDVEELEKAVSQLIVDFIEKEKNKAIKIGLEEKDQEIQKLRRRISKLTDALEKAEVTLKEISENGKVIPGISSIFRTVQGLDKSDPMFIEKKTLLKDIFVANLELQKGIIKK